MNWLAVLLIASIALMLFSQTVSAVSYCTNETYSITETNSSGDVLEACANGCLNGKCQDKSSEMIALAIVFFAIVGGLIYAGMNFSEESPFRVLAFIFIPVALTLAVVPIFVFVNWGAFDSNSGAIVTTAAFAVIIVVIVTVATTFILLVSGYFEKFFPYSERDKKEF